MHVHYPTDESICAHVGDDGFSMNPVVPPIYMNSLHVFPTMEAMWAFDRKDPRQFTYGRVSNPTVAVTEQKIAALEHADAALCFASGMAALTSAMMCFLRAGSHVIAPRNVYGVTRAFLDNYAPRFGIETTYVVGTDLGEIEGAIRPNTHLIYLESPTSMNFLIQDIRAITAMAKARGIGTLIDNSWCTPIFQKPLDMGVDLTCHTMSKYMGGHSDIVGGCIAGRRELIDRIAQNEREMFGGIIGPMEGALVTRGLRTLPLRMRAHEASALKVAAHLEKAPYVSRVIHPGLPSHPQYELARAQMTGTSGVFAAVMNLSPAQTVAFINGLKLFQIGVSWGGHESLALCSFIQETQERLDYFGVARTQIRLVVGLETADELIEDIERAAAAARATCA